jgi:predicted O-linked N-acetylglucosamine transferase (SPINDLY family)
VAINNLGIAFYKLHQTDEAINCYKQALALNPNFADAHNNLGMVLLDLGQFDAAVKSYKSALKIKPDFVAAINNLGIAFYKLQQEDEAIKCYKKAISLKPDFVDAYANLASVMKVLNRFDEALAIYESEIIQNSNLDFILGELFNMKMHLCIWDDLPRRLDELKNKINNNEKVISPFILLALVDDPEIQRKNTEIYVNFKFPNNNVLPAIGIYPKHSKIRIGYFSADFREHPVSSLTAELYEMHDRNQFEIHAFSFGPDTKDEMNLRIKAGVDHFHEVRMMSHKDVAMLSRSLEIDIAIDLGGYTQDARSEIFAMSAAPIQASYIGVLSTMGVDYYDYLLAGQGMIPESNQKYFSEKIVYLPTYQVNDSKEILPEITFTRKELGLPEKGFVFCCFNHTYKIMPTVFNSWARILNDVKESVMFIYVDNELAKTNLIREIADRGINPSRLIFGKRLSKSKYLARYQVADLFLDTHPYNAGATASDALRMGLPVLTLEGKSFNSRSAASIISALNLPQLITSSEKEYETLAVELGNDPEKLKLIKEKLASNLSTAPLYDTPLFTKNLESAFSQMYYRYQQGLEPKHIYLKQDNSKALK